MAPLLNAGVLKSSPLLTEESARPNRERRARLAAGILRRVRQPEALSLETSVSPTLRAALRSAQIGNSGYLWVFFILDDIFRSQRDDDFCMVSLWVTSSNLIATAAIDFSRTQWSVRVAQWPRPGLARPTCRRVWQAGSLHIFR